MSSNIIRFPRRKLEPLPSDKIARGVALLERALRSDEGRDTFRRLMEAKIDRLSASSPHLDPTTTPADG